MIRNTIFKISACVCISAALTVTSIAAQTDRPTDSRLLNGLRVLVFKKQDDKLVTVKLRLHSGSAFDPLGKEGTMTLLAKSFFPSEAINDYFRDDLGGSLTVTSNHDFIQIVATGSPEKLIELLEPLASGVINTEITKELTARLKGPAVELVGRLEQDAGYLGVRAAARNLVGDFPYGRPVEGSVASISKIDFADLSLAKERFVTADNATLAVRGNVDPAYVLKVVKRLFGSWNKADKKVPLTFAQPEPPKQPLINQPLAALPEGSVNAVAAFRAFPRSDSRFNSFRVIEKILRARLAERFGLDFIMNTSGTSLAPVVVISISGTAANEATLRPLNFLAADITEAEFSRAYAIVSSQTAATDPADFWLDSDTYRLQGADSEIARLKNLTINEVQKVLKELRETPSVTTVFTLPKS